MMMYICLTLQTADICCSLSLQTNTAAISEEMELAFDRVDLILQ